MHSSNGRVSACTAAAETENIGTWSQVACPGTHNRAAQLGRQAQQTVHSFCFCFAGQGRQGPRARGMDGVLGGAGEGAAPADLDSVLSVLPEEEAVRWKGIIEADTQRQERMLAAEAAGAGADSGFSDAYSALRMAGRRGASSGLLGLLDSRDEEGAEE